jgi:hypothetical protein
MKTINYFVVVLLLLLSSCIITKKMTEQEIYKKALQNACIPQETTIYKNLTAINISNINLTRKIINGQEYILTISLKSEQAKKWYQNDTNGFYHTGKYQIWVTITPELQQKIKALNPKNIPLRLKQLLGLPPNAEYKYMIEFWVKADDLFRPCPDKEITDRQCELDFPQNTPEEYKKWFNDVRLERYFVYKDMYAKYPWTQLGYTYDWSPKNHSHIGMSEFVIDKNKNVVVGNIYTLEEYFKK